MKQAYVSHIHSQLHLRGCALRALHIDRMKCTKYTVCCKSALVYHVSVLISSARAEKQKTQGYKIREEKKTDAAPKSVALCNFQFSSNVSFVSLNTEIWR